MTSTSQFNRSTALSANDSLLIAFFIAALIHIVLLLSIRFVPPTPAKIHRSMDVTLVNTPTPKAPKEANFLAPENQQGAGEAQAEALPPVQQLAGGSSDPQPPAPVPQPVIKQHTPEPGVAKPVKKVITKRKSEQKVIPVSKPERPETVNSEPQRPHLSPVLLQQQLAQLGTEIRHSQPNAGLGNIKFISEVSTHKYIAAQYLKDWEMKVERVGNMNYPEVAAKKNFSGTLTMAVTINADGSLHDITINRSSGNPALDEAAKRIVRMSAPFAPLPLELLKELNPKILGITRIWKFSDESMSAK